jgi:rubrerythrin
VSLLKQEPSQAVRTLDELFAIAFAMEEEAATRYGEIAVRMRDEGNAELADVFERLANDERGHRDSVVHWSEKEKGRAPDPALVRWQLPETFDDEGAGTTDARLLTAYRALSMAVRNEERAFAFWSYVTAHAASPEIRRAAEAMAHEELEHVATLRRERRRAFHAERSAGHGPEERPMHDAAALERRLAEQLDRVAQGAGAGGSGRIRAMAEEARRNAHDLTQLGAPLLALRGFQAIPDDPVALSEVLVDHYLELAERSGDEAAVDLAQVLAGRAVRRLAWLRAEPPEIA